MPTYRATNKIIEQRVLFLSSHEDKLKTIFKEL